MNLADLPTDSLSHLLSFVSPVERVYLQHLLCRSIAQATQRSLDSERVVAPGDEHVKRRCERMLEYISSSALVSRLVLHSTTSHLCVLDLLSLRSQLQVTMYSYRAIASHCRALQTLKIALLEDHTFDHILYLPALQTLALEIVSADDAMERNEKNVGSAFASPVALVSLWLHFVGAQPHFGLDPQQVPGNRNAADGSVARLNRLLASLRKDSLRSLAIFLPNTDQTEFNETFLAPFTSLTSLRLECFYFRLKDRLPPALEHASLCVHFNLRRFKNLIAHPPPKARVLRFNAPMIIDGVACKQFLDQTPHLQTFVLPRLAAFNKQFLLTQIAEHPVIAQLSEMCSPLYRSYTMQHLRSLVSHSTKLRLLDLSYHDCIDTDVLHLLASLHHLRTLLLFNANIEPQALQDFMQARADSPASLPLLRIYLNAHVDAYPSNAAVETCELRSILQLRRLQTFGDDSDLWR